MHDLCYLCGKPAALPLALKSSFTAHSLCKATTSSHMCDRCHYAVNTRYWYWNDARQKWSALYFRCLSSLWQRDKLISPIVGPEKTQKAGKQGSFTLPTVENLPTRSQIRDWLISPPKPPFSIVIAESGQKHIVPWAIDGHDRNYFPVQFELDSLWIDRAQFVFVLGAFESLMALGFSKTEIVSGNYHSDRLMQAWGRYEQHESTIGPLRGSRFLQLVGYVAQQQPKPEEKTKSLELQPSIKSEVSAQLTLL